MRPCYVYGAQTMAYDIVQALEHAGQQIEGYVVTRMEGNPSSIRGKAVVPIDALDLASRPKFFVAVPGYLHEEIGHILEAKGFHDYECVDADREYRWMKEYYRSEGRLKFLEDHGTLEASESGAVPSRDLEIYVAKSAGDHPLAGAAAFPEGCVTVQAGAALGPAVPADFRDDEGENISVRNSHYDELTVAYWAWKNRRVAVKGLFHYRRCIALTAEERRALLDGRVDAVLPLPFLCYPDTGMQYARYNRPEAVEAMLSAIGRVHGEKMRSSAEKVLKGDLLYNYNMLVAQAGVFDGYCSWMFPVLAEVEELCRDMLPEGVHTRICGHLGELLETIYFRSCGIGLRVVHGKKVWFV